MLMKIQHYLFLTLATFTFAYLLQKYHNSDMLVVVAYVVFCGWFCERLEHIRLQENMNFVERI